MQLATKKALTLEAAKLIAAAAQAEARKNGWNMVICVVDDGGHLIYLERMDGTQLGSVQVAQDKARTAVLFKRPSKARKVSAILVGWSLSRYTPSASFPPF